MTINLKHIIYASKPFGFSRSDLDHILIREKNIDKEKVNQLIEERNNARQNKEFKKADTLRETLLKMDILIKDSPEGTQWEVNKTTISD